MTLQDIRSREKVMEQIQRYLSGLIENSREWNNHNRMYLQLKHEVDVAKSMLTKEQMEMLRRMD